MTERCAYSDAEIGRALFAPVVMGKCCECGVDARKKSFVLVTNSKNDAGGASVDACVRASSAYCCVYAARSLGSRNMCGKEVKDQVAKGSLAPEPRYHCRWALTRPRGINRTHTSLPRISSIHLVTRSRTLILLSFCTAFNTALSTNPGQYRELQAAVAVAVSIPTLPALGVLTYRPDSHGELSQIDLQV